MSEHKHSHYHHDHNHEHCGCSCDCGHNHNHEHNHQEDGNALKKILFGGILFAIGMLLDHINFEPYFNGVQNFSQYQKYSMAAFFLLSYMILGREVVKSAIYNLFKGQIFGEQFLMSVASLGAVCVGQLPEAVAIMLFYQIGEWFEDFAVDKSKDSINSLMEIRPDSATVLRDGKENLVKADEVQIGEKIIVKPGERIPVDGTITKGSSFIDNSALTGESVPLEVFEGVEVFSGAINKSAVLEIKTSRLAGDSAASRILKLVETSMDKKTKTERFITRFSRMYTPTVCALALLVSVIPVLVIGMLSGSFPWSTWIYRGLMFLVVSCPCAIVISVPLTFFGGIGKASRMGILLKGSGCIEALSRAKITVFDKTGTLTKGVFAVTEICPAESSISPDQLLALAAHAEVSSNHPVAKSLLSAHNGECCKSAKLKDQEEIPGHGIKVTLNGKTVLAGNSKLMTSNNIEGFEKAIAAEKSGTVVHIAEEGKYLGHIVISDEEKEDAKNAVSLLKKTGVEKIVMLTGDNEKAAAKTASELGITDVYPELLPEDKVTQVEALLETLKSNGKSRGTLLFTGDGINDAPVLARADIGIAMGALGSDAAIESADVVIMNDEPSKIPEAISISRKTISIVRQNIVFSVGVKILIMVLSGIGITNMWMAVFGDVGVTFLAILNSMRALGFSKIRHIKNS